MEPKEGFNLSHFWAEGVTDITGKVTKSYEASDHDLIRAVADSAFLKPWVFQRCAMHSHRPKHLHRGQLKSGKGAKTSSAHS